MKVCARCGVLLKDKERMCPVCGCAKTLDDNKKTTKNEVHKDKVEKRNRRE